MTEYYISLNAMCTVYVLRSPDGHVVVASMDILLCILLV